MIVCSCRRVRDAEIRELAAQSEQPLRLRDLRRCLGVCGECGRCGPTAQQLLRSLNHGGRVEAGLAATLATPEPINAACATCPQADTTPRVPTPTSAPTPIPAQAANVVFAPHVATGRSRARHAPSPTSTPTSTRPFRSTPSRLTTDSAEPIVVDPSRPDHHAPLDRLPLSLHRDRPTLGAHG